MKTPEGGFIADELTNWLINHEGASVLRDLTDLRERIEQGIERQVVLLRDVGASWEDIGRYLGISRQAAWERFAFTNEQAARRWKRNNTQPN